MLARIALTYVAALVVAGTGWAQWTAAEEAKLAASDASLGDRFGFDIAFHGDTTVVGAPFETNAGGINAGSVYVFVRNGANWSEQAKLTASDAEDYDWFGYSVAIYSDTIVISALKDDQAGNYSGGVYVFVRTGTAWTEQAKLMWSSASSGDYFGYSVSIYKDTVAVGAPGDGIAGRAYVFVRNGTNWTEQGKLGATQTPIPTFGQSVCVFGDTLVVGEPYDDHKNYTYKYEGSAHIFVRSGTTWSNQASIKASDAAEDDYFGWSVAIDGNTVVVGAYGDSDAGEYSGSAYVFSQNGTSWSEQAKLTASDARAGDLFGWSASLSGDTVVIGAPQDSFTVNNAGSAYVYACSGTTWIEQVKIVAGDPEEGVAFGESVACSADTVLVGATYASTISGMWTGAAYVFEVAPELPTIYCTAGESAGGCVAQIGGTGTPSATALSGFFLTAADVEGAKEGMFYFGTNGQQAIPWGNGTSFQCVVPPVERAGLIAGSGSLGACDGSFVQDLNALWCPTCPKPHKNPGAGALVQAQLWYRDPLSTSNQTTSLSDAIEFTLGP